MAWLFIQLNCFDIDPCCRYQYFIPFYLSTIQLFVYTTFTYPFIYWWTFWVLFGLCGLWLLQIKPLWAFDQTWACFPFLGKYLEVEGLIYVQLSKKLLNCSYRLVFPAAMSDGSWCYMPLLAFDDVIALDFSHSNRHVVISHCCFNLKFPNGIRKAVEGGPGGLEMDQKWSSQNATWCRYGMPAPQVVA